ncbi:MAG: aminodeoxychorismate synthase component I [Peptostreptococcaceae bacterium]
MIKRLQTNYNSFEIFSIFKNEKDSFILDSSMHFKDLGRYSIIGFNPFKTIKLKDYENTFDKLEEELNRYKVINKTNLPFIGGAVGYISYDSYQYVENIKESAIDDINGYDIYFGFYDIAIVIDHLEDEKYIVTPNLDTKNEYNKVIEVEQKILNSVVEKRELIECKETKLTSNFTKEEFENAVLKVKEYIKSGDIYQVNLTQRFSGKTNIDSFDLYEKLRKISPSTFSAFLNFEGYNVLSNSPERFIKVIDNNIETRPIKGTRPRGIDEKHDLELIEELKNSEKDKSELLMIVDLERNDLSKICDKVEVPSLFEIESYANVHHLVSSVCGEINEDISIKEILKATFPGGSITGAPKIRAMEIIEELEGIKRNVYTGSIGYISFCSNMDFNIAIRTLIKKNDEFYFQVGGAVTWDSNPSEEYQETLDKAKSIIGALNGKL